MLNRNTETFYKEISKLKDYEKLILLTKLMTELSTGMHREQKLNIYDIKGIGKDIWEGIDAQEYVNKERSSWE
jgi:hypothetical protein